MTESPSSRHNLIKGSVRGRSSGRVCCSNICLAVKRPPTQMPSLPCSEGWSKNDSLSSESGVSQLFTSLPHPHASLNFHKTKFARRTDIINAIKFESQFTIKDSTNPFGNISPAINSSIPAERFNKLRGIFPGEWQSKKSRSGDNKLRFKDKCRTNDRNPSSRHNLIKGCDRGCSSGRIAAQIFLLLLSARSHKYCHYLGLKGGANDSFPCGKWSFPNSFRLSSIHMPHSFHNVNVVLNVSHFQ
ncbi:hypothetical protein CEXT_759531 [Caerostris extrusa]|uniref:Uncharacterized protein n=1 Tax=Caerostris extrusa TaxID=172846 RepID=A0AAV4MD09_CAEEX|nr:hypothetical protein CEXT_759531 [Caerostris extrusa]